MVVLNSNNRQGLWLPCFCTSATTLHTLFFCVGVCMGLLLSPWAGPVNFVGMA